MQTLSLEAELREQLSRGKLNALRGEGWLPAVIYGGGAKKSAKAESVHLKVKEKSLLKLIGGHQWTNLIIDLHWGKETSNVLIKEIQRDAVTRKFLHVDFQRISMTEKLEVMVPVHIAGEAPGVKNSGGILEHITRELKILCLPKDMPAQINVDVSKLEIGHGVTVKDIQEIPGVQILTDSHTLVVNVVAPTAIEEPAAAAAAAAAPGAAEPEVIKKGKKPEEGEAAQGAAAPAAGGKAQEKAAPQGQKAAAPQGGAK